MTPAQLLLIVRILLAIALYLFLGYLLFVQWKDLNESRLFADAAPSACLVAVEGITPGIIFALDTLNEVGRAADNSIRLDDETVSSHHARIFYHGGQWWLEDLASRNGTHVNDLRVDEPLVVAFGDQLRFGKVYLRLEEGG